MGFMALTTFFALFGAAWLSAALYIGSTLMLDRRIRALKDLGRAGDVPNSSIRTGNLLDAMRYVQWLLSGRYQDLNDEIVTRWSSLARVFFLATLPLFLAVLFVVLTQQDALNAQF